MADLITSSAEAAHGLYKKASDLLRENPSLTNSVNDFLSEYKGGIAGITDLNLNTMGWGDLFNIWLLQLGEFEDVDGFPVLSFGENAKTTKELQTQEGVSNFRETISKNIQAGNLDSIKDSWTYGQKGFYDGIAEMNTATSFLGSYNMSATIAENPDGTCTVTYVVTNTTGWASATRLRKDNDNDEIHDPIFEDTKRGESLIDLGGTIQQDWTWTEVFDKN